MYTAPVKFPAQAPHVTEEAASEVGFASPDGEGYFGTWTAGSVIVDITSVWSDQL